MWGVSNPIAEFKREGSVLPVMAKGKDMSILRIGNAVSSGVGGLIKRKDGVSPIICDGTGMGTCGLQPLYVT